MRQGLEKSRGPAIFNVKHVFFCKKAGRVSSVWSGENPSCQSLFQKTPRLDLTLEQTRYLQDRGGKPKMLSSTKLSILGRAATQVFTIEVLIQSASTNWWWKGLICLRPWAQRICEGNMTFIRKKWSSWGYCFLLEFRHAAELAFSMEIHFWNVHEAPDTVAPSKTTSIPRQWIHCDMRSFPLSIFKGGNVAAVNAEKIPLTSGSHGRFD